MKVHTQAVHFSADSKLLLFIEKKLQKLEQFFDRIIEANVILRLENSGKIRDKIVEVKISIPGGTLFARESSKTFEASVDDAATALKRQLIKYKDRIRSNNG
ncbi:MAG: ribosome-associated translation inhibitor RaiA [Bacteroidota bacterium]